MLALKDLLAGLGATSLDCRQDGAHLDAGRREFYLFNSTIAGIDEADALLIIGSNPRREAPVLNARIRKRKLASGFPIGVIGRRRRSPTRRSGWARDRPSSARCQRRLRRPWRKPSGPW